MIDCVWEEYTESVKVCGPDGCRRVEQKRLRCTNPGCKHKYPPVDKKTGLLKRPLKAKGPRWNCEYQPDLIPIAERLGITLEEAKRNAGALVRWMNARFPVRDQEEVEWIERNLCQPCDEYVDGRCKQGGCGKQPGGLILSKAITMATVCCKLYNW